MTTTLNKERAMMKLSVEFFTSEYRNNHGAEPRGRGSWAFSEKRSPDTLRDTVLWSPSMTFCKAKKWARGQVRNVQGAMGHVVLYVQP